MKSKSIKILSFVFAILMIFQHIALASSTVDLFTDEMLNNENNAQDVDSLKKVKTVDILDEAPQKPKTVDILDEAPQKPKTVDILSPKNYVGDKEEETKVKPKENIYPKTKTVDLFTDENPNSEDISKPGVSNKEDLPISIGDDLIDISDFDNKENVDANKDFNVDENSAVDYDTNENAGILPWHTDIIKPWSLYREPKKVYKPGDDLDLSLLLVEIKTGRSGSLYNIEDILNDEFAKIYRVKKSDGSHVSLSDKITEDEVLTIHMDGCEDIVIDLSVDENLKSEGYEAFQYNLISALKESLNDMLDFSLYVIGKGEVNNPKIAYSLDPLKMSPLGRGEDGRLIEGELYSKKDNFKWDRYDKETLGKVKNILIKSDEFRFKDSIRYKLVTQLAIWNVTSNLLPDEVDKDNKTEIDGKNVDEEPEEKDVTDESIKDGLKSKDIVLDGNDKLIDEVKSDVNLVDSKDETEDKEDVKPEKDEEIVAEDNAINENEKNLDSNVKKTVKTIEFNTSEFDIPYNRVRLTEDEYLFYKELTEVKSVDLDDDEKFEIFEPSDSNLAELVTYGTSDLEKIDRIDKKITFDAVDYRFKNVYKPIESYSMIGFGQPDLAVVSLFSRIKASRDIKKGDKLTVKIENDYEPFIEDNDLNGVTFDGEVVATREYNEGTKEIIYTFTKDLKTSEVELNEEFKEIDKREEELPNDSAVAMMYGMLSVGRMLVYGDGRDKEYEGSRPVLNNIRLLVGNTPIVSGFMYGFENKKFRFKSNIKTLTNGLNVIPRGWYFDIDFGPYVKFDYNTQMLRQIRDARGRVIVRAENRTNGPNCVIRYKFLRRVSNANNLNIDQLFAFNTSEIGKKNPINVNIKVIDKQGRVKILQPIKASKFDPRSSIDSSTTVENRPVGSLATIYPYMLNYKAYESFSGEDYNLTIDVDTQPMLNKNLDFKSLGLSIYAPKNQGLWDYKAEVNGVETHFDENGLLDLHSEVISKDKLTDKLHIEVSAKVQVKKDSYSFGLRITPDSNYIKKLREELESKINEMGSASGFLLFIFRYLSDPNNSTRFDQGFNLLDTRIKTLAYPGEDENLQVFGFNNERISFYPYKYGENVGFKLSETIRLEDDKPKYAELVFKKLNNNVSLMPNDPDVNVFIPNSDGTYRLEPLGTVNSYYLFKNKMKNITVLPGTIVEYDFKGKVLDKNKDATVTIGEIQAVYNENPNFESGVYHIGKLVGELYGTSLMKVMETGETAYCINPQKADPVRNDNRNKRIELNPSNVGILRDVLNEGNSTNVTKNYYRILDNLKRTFFFAREIEKRENPEFDNSKVRRNLAAAVQGAVFKAVGEGDIVNAKAVYNYLTGDLSNPMDINSKRTGIISSYNDEKEGNISRYYNEIVKNFAGNDSIGTKLTEDELNSVRVFLYKTENNAGNKDQNVVVGNVTDPVEIAKTDENGNKLNGARLRISSNSFSKEWTSSEKDEKLYLPTGNYVIDELSAPNGFNKIQNIPFEVANKIKTRKIKIKRGDSIFDADERLNSITLIAANNENIKVDKDRLKLTVINMSGNEVVVKKVDEDNNPLKGAKFGIFNLDNTPVKINGENVESISGEDGSAKFKNLEPGEYYIKEIEAPNDYSQISSVIRVIVSDDKKVSLSTDDKNGFITIENSIDKTKNVQIDEIKKNQIYPDFINWKSELVSSQNNTVITRLYLNPLTDNQYGLGPNKETRLRLYCDKAESVCAKVYVVSSNLKNNLNKNTDLTKFHLKDACYEKPNPIDINIPSTDKRWDGKCIVVDIVAQFNEKLTDRTVRAKWSGIGVDEGTYLESDLGIISSTLEGNFVTVKNIKGAEFKIRKVSKDDENKVLPGAEFTLYDKNGDVPIQLNGKPYVVTTGEDGIAHFTGIKEGEYVVKETKAPLGYDKLEKTWKITVKKENGKYRVFLLSDERKLSGYNYGEAKTAVFGDGESHYLNIDALFEKAEDGWTKLTIQAEKFYEYGNFSGSLVLGFDTTNFDVREIVNNQAVDLRYNPIYYNDLNFTREYGIDNPNNYLIYQYYVKLKKVVLTSISPISFIGVVKDRADNFIDKASGKEIITIDPVFYDNTSPTNIELTDSNGRCIIVKNKQITRDIEFVKIGDNNVRLQGAKFNLARVRDDDEEVIQKDIVSGENGLIKINGLTPGDYKLIETSAPKGYVVPIGPSVQFKITNDGKVTVFKDGEYVELDNNKIDDPNRMIKNFTSQDGKFKIKKLDSDGKKLEGAKFGLFEGKWTDIKDDAEPIKTGVTDQSGSLSFEGLDVGLYTLKEIEAPEGYKKVNNTWTVKVYESGYTVVKMNPEKPNNDDYQGINVNNKVSVSNVKFNVEHQDRRYIYPNREEFFYISYDLDFDNDIKKNDWFTIKYDDNIRREGTEANYVPNDLKLPQGTLAVAQLLEDGKTVKYTFTELIEEIRDAKANIDEAVNIDRYIVKNNEWINVNNDIAGKKFIQGQYYIYYEPYSENNEFFHFIEADSGQLMVSSFINKIHRDNSTIEHISYIKFNYNNNNLDFSFSLENIKSAILKDASIEVYKVDASEMLQSYGLDFTKLNKVFTKEDGEDIKKLEFKGINKNDNYIVRTITRFDKNEDVVAISGKLFSHQSNKMVTFESQTVTKPMNADASGKIDFPELNVINNKINLADIEFTKVDSKNHTIVLKDAEFTLFKQFEVEGNKSFNAVDVNGNKVDDINNAYKVNSKEDGKIKFIKLKDGIYAIKETKAPMGYQRPGEYVFRFEVSNGEVFKLDDAFKRIGKAIDKTNKDVYPINVDNKKVEYPQTGGIGSIIFTIIGFSMMFFATFVLKKRKECYE